MKHQDHRCPKCNGWLNEDRGCDACDSHSSLFCLRCDGKEFVEAVRDVEVDYHSRVFKVTTEVMVCTKCGWFTCTLAQADELNRKTKASVST